MSLNARILTVAQEVLAKLTSEEDAASTRISIESGFPHRIRMRRADDEELTMSFAAADDGSHMIEVARHFSAGNSSVEHFTWEAGQDEPEAVYAALDTFAAPLELEA